MILFRFLYLLKVAWLGNCLRIVLANEHDPQVLWSSLLIDDIKGSQTVVDLKVEVISANTSPRLGKLRWARNDVELMMLSLTRGTWDKHQWGDPRYPTLPHGATLKAEFLGSHQDAERNWDMLVKWANQLLCSSASLWQNPAPCSPIMTRLVSPSHCLETALPTSSLCLENMAAWLSLLPCTDKAGMASLFRNRVQLMRAPFLSLSLQISKGNGPQTGRLHIVMHVKAVLGPLHLSEPVPDNLERSLAHLFGSPLLRPCIGETSRVFVSQYQEPVGRQSCGTSNGNYSYLCLRREEGNKDSNFSITPPSTWISCMETPGGAGWPEPCTGPKIWQVYRKSGSGSSILLYVTPLAQGTLGHGSFQCCIQISFPEQVVPLLHQMRWTTTSSATSKDVSISHTAQASLRKASTIKTCTSLLQTEVLNLEVPFQHAFTAVEDYSSDPEKGVYIPACRMTWDNAHQQGTVYSNPILMKMPTPDFSMPYNVLCMTLTTLSVYVGASSALLLRKRT